ncbi:MAG: hypothetical protein HRT57_04400 [Crocinitomicaceae bacterium]|nr:hypothetical protein [Crocinitomicaceae bacterium]
MKSTLLFSILALTLLGCSKTTSTNTVEVPIYISDAALSSDFNGVVPYIKLTQSGTSVDHSFLVNTCSVSNSSPFAFEKNTSYYVEFGSYSGNTWVTWQNYGGTIYVDDLGNLSGNIYRNWGSMYCATTTDYAGCTNIISGDICLFN